jgi:hypothetical protein
MLKNNWEMNLIDVETAFLYGDLEEEIYLKIPSGYKENFGNAKNKCLLLRKSLYGLVQASRQWWKFFIKTLRAINFKKSEIDPCLLIHKDKYGTVMLCVYVDDVLCIGDIVAIQKAIQAIQKHFAIKQMSQVKTYIGCSFVWDNTKTKLFLCQPELIAKMKKDFKKEIESLRKTETPSPPGEIVMRPKDESELIDEEAQKKY